MTKFIKFCMAFLGLDLFFMWITSPSGKTSIQKFFGDLSKVGLSIILFHIIGVLVLGLLTDYKFFGEYWAFLTSWNTIKHSEYLIGFGVLVALGVTATMVIFSALVAFVLIVAFAIAIPISVWQWGKRKWIEIYGTKSTDEDDDDLDSTFDDEECSTCEEVR